MPDATIEVEDEAVVTTDVEDDPVAEGTPSKKQEGTNGVAAATAAGAVDEAAAALKKSLEDSKKRENAALATAEAERRRADQEAARATAKDREVQAARNVAANSQLTVITNRIDAAKRDLDAAKVAFRVAHEAGDVDKMADAQAQIGTAAAQIDRYTADKESFEAATAARTEQPDVVDTAQPQDRSIETYITRFKYAPPAAAFLRAHPECLPPDWGGTAEKNEAMMAGHYAAKAQKIPLNSEKYFEVIQSFIDGNGTPLSSAATTTAAGGDEAAAAQQRQQPRKQPVPAAPPSREPPAADGTPTGKVTVKLDTQQQEMALLSYPQKQGEDDKAWKKRAFGTYASEYAKAKKEGIIGRMTH